MKKIVSALSLIATGCAASTPPPRPLAPHSAITVSSGFDRGEIAQGDLVSVTGYLPFGDDRHNIWESKAIYDRIDTEFPPLSDPMWKACVSLASYGRLRHRLLHLDGKMVTVTGYIIRHIPQEHEINLGSCSNIRIKLDGPDASVKVQR